MNDDERTPILSALARTREALEASWPQERAPIYSQGWVDRRRLLVVDLALEFSQQVLEGAAVDARRMAERIEAVLHVAHDVAPGYGLDRAAACVLEGLSGEWSEEPGH